MMTLALKKISSTSQEALLKYLEVRNLSFTYQAKKPVLSDVSFHLNHSEILGILGPNGAGKTTLFEILTGLISTSSGEFFLKETAMRPNSPGFRDSLGVVFQKPSLDLKLSAQENLMLSAGLFCVPKNQALRKADELLSLMELSDRRHDLVGKFSGGMKRKLEIARAFMHEPAFLILDEPTTGLDEVAFQTVWRTLHHLREQQKTTLLLTTHHANEAEQCDRLLILDHGSIIVDGTPDALKRKMGGDVLELQIPTHVVDLSAMVTEIQKQFNLQVTLTNNTLHITSDKDLHHLIPKIVEHFPKNTFESLNLHKPTLADVFVALTGRTLNVDGTENQGTPHAKI